MPVSVDSSSGYTYLLFDRQNNRNIFEKLDGINKLFRQCLFKVSVMIVIFTCKCSKNFVNINLSTDISIKSRNESIERNNVIEEYK